MLSNFYRRFIFGYLGSFVFLLTSCEHDNQSNTTVVQIDKTVLAEKSMQPASAESSRHSEGKPGANILLLSSGKLNGDLNKVSSDIISLKLARDRDWNLQLTSDPEVEILSEAQLQISALDSIDSASQEKFDLPIRWVPKKTGRFYLNLHVSHTSLDSAEARNFALILDVKEVGTAAILNKQESEKKSVGQSKATPSVIELPADEKIKSNK